MQRHRQVAAAPVRRASETWETIGQLIVDTLDRSPHIERSAIEAAVEAASTVGRALVAAGHLDEYPVVVVADPLYLDITTVSGGPASTLEENLGPVPGGATSTDWMIYLPTPDPVADAVRAAVAAHSHLSAEEPPADSGTYLAKVETESVLNLAALADRAREQS
jgi:hypothetical protein